MNHPLFHVGEIAIAVNAHPSLARYEGAECEIVDDLRQRDRYRDFPPMYDVRFADGFQCYAMENNLRKRHERGDWSELRDVWQPAPKVTESHA